MKANALLPAACWKLVDLILCMSVQATTDGTSSVALHAQKTLSLWYLLTSGSHNFFTFLSAFICQGKLFHNHFIFDSKSTQIYEPVGEEGKALFAILVYLMLLEFYS